MAFTAISAGLDWQDKDFLNELTSSCLERCDAAGYTTAPYSSIAAINAGDDIQDLDVFKNMQTILEALAVVYVDHNASIAGEASVPKFTIPSWRTEAGIGVAGSTAGESFRRAAAWDTDIDDWTDPADAMWTTTGDHDGDYGFMQAGDIIGPWVFDDIQKGLIALKWTTQSGSLPVDEEYRTSGPESDADCGTASTDQDNAWTASSWGSISSTLVYWVQGWRHYTADPLYTFDGKRIRGKPYFENIYSTLFHVADIYFIPTGTSGFGFLDFDADIHVVDMVEDELWFFETLARAQAATRTGTLHDPDSTNPVTKASIGCDTSNEDYSISVDYANCKVVLKWEFSYDS